MNNAWQIGSGKVDITPKIKGISMLGYGNPHHVVRGVETPIYARVICLQTGQDKLLLINLEVCFITDILRKNILREIKSLMDIPESSVHISAQHTHSAHGGYTHYALYNMPTPGFVPEVLETYTLGTVKAIQEALANLRTMQVEYAESQFSPDIPVSFNRSLIAYLQNPEVKELGLREEKSGAVDKTMRALLFKQDGELSGLINWFAVHTTSLPNSSMLVSSDNKGYAALEVEKNHSKDNFIAIFAQGDAGDVSPNWVWDANKKVMRGHFADPFENAKFNGKLQAKKCEEIIQSKQTILLENKIDSAIVYVDMSNVVPDRKFLPKDAPPYAATTSAAHGVAFAQGALEGPGVNKPIAFVLKVLATLVKFYDFLRSFFMPEDEKLKLWHYYRNQAPKIIFAESGKKRVLGISNLAWLTPLKLVDPLVATMVKFYKQGSMREHTWTQHILPLQLIRLGEVLMIGLPAESTTMSGFRIRKQLLELFKDEGVTKVITAPYANAFCGYIVTPEEYEMQCYEGGHCVFGKYTLPAFQTMIEKLAKEMLKPKEQRDFSWSLATPEFSKSELDGRTYKK
jgi:neutral ceramidase